MTDEQQWQDRLDAQRDQTRRASDLDRQRREEAARLARARADSVAQLPQFASWFAEQAAAAGLATEVELVAGLLPRRVRGWWGRTRVSLDDDGRYEDRPLFLTVQGMVFARRVSRSGRPLVPFAFDTVGGGLFPPVTAGHLRDALIKRLGSQ